MEQHRTNLIVFGGLTRNFEDELNGADPVGEPFQELFVCSLTKYAWTRVMIDSGAMFVGFASVARTSESELLLFGGVDHMGTVR